MTMEFTFTWTPHRFSVSFYFKYVYSYLCNITKIDHIKKKFDIFEITQQHALLSHAHAPFVGFAKIWLTVVCLHWYVTSLCPFSPFVAKSSFEKKKKKIEGKKKICNIRVKYAFNKSIYFEYIQSLVGKEKRQKMKHKETSCIQNYSNHAFSMQLYIQSCSAFYSNIYTTAWNHK